MKMIGIDLGTTTISLVVYDPDKELTLETITRNHGSFIASAHNWEKIQDIERIIKSAKEALDELLARHSDISAIGLTGQMHGILYLNSQGKAISPLITWQDQRGNLKVFEEKSITELIQKNCQLHVPSGYGLNTHLTNLKWKLVPQYAVSFCTAPDYLGMILTDQKQPLLHSSMAASFGFFDCKNHQFQIQEIQKMGIDPNILPKVTKHIEKLGTYQGIPVTLALGDCQASFLGSVGFREKTLLLNIGTGSQISICSDQVFQTLNIEARPFLNDQILLCGSSLCGGRSYAILENFFREYAKMITGNDQDQYEFMAKLVKQTNFQNCDLTAITTFNGTRSNPDEKGSLLHLSEDNFTPGNLILAVLKGMIQELYDYYAEILQKTNIQPTGILASGNGFRKNPLLQKLAEEKFQLPLELAKQKEEAAIGAAISSRLFQQKGRR